MPDQGTESLKPTTVRPNLESLLTEPTIQSYWRSTATGRTSMQRLWLASALLTEGLQRQSILGWYTASGLILITTTCSPTTESTDPLSNVAKTLTVSMQPIVESSPSKSGSGKRVEELVTSAHALADDVACLLRPMTDRNDLTLNVKVLTVSFRETSETGCAEQCQSSILEESKNLEQDFFSRFTTNSFSNALLPRARGVLSTSKRQWKGSFLTSPYPSLQTSV